MFPHRGLKSHPHHQVPHGDIPVRSYRYARVGGAESHGGAFPGGDTVRPP